MKRPLLLVLSFTATLIAAAQTMFIPDTYLRTWLNNAKPNIVDVNGYCDTLNWNLVPPSNVYFYFYNVPNNSTVDLTGIQYLKMSSLKITDVSLGNISVIWPGHPRNNNNLELVKVDAQLFSGPLLPLPLTLGTFQCDACGLTTLPAFNGVQLVFKNVDLGGQTLTVPNSVMSLTVSDCNLTQIPLCPNLFTLVVDGNPLADWTNVPTGLNTLMAADVGLSYLPTLPPNLVWLYCPGNGLTTLPALPSSIASLSLERNQFTSIPALPPNLSALALFRNPITSLPSLPSSLASLTADSCAFTTIGPLSSALVTLSLSANPLTELPALPANLTTLNLKNCTALECLPLLPQSLVNLRLYNSGVTCLPNIPPNLNILGGQSNLGISPIYCDLTNTDCDLVIPYATGTIFNDADIDGVMDVGESPRSYGIVTAEPGDFLAGSDINGRYVMPLDVGTFTIDGLASQYEPITSAPHVVTFTGLGQIDSLNHVGYEHVPGIYDLVTSIHGTVVRPGFYCSTWVTVHNAGTEPTAALVQLTFDEDLSYTSSSYAPNSVNANVIEWNSGTIYPGMTWTVNVTFMTPISVLLGTPIEHQAAATPDLANLTPTDNLALLNDTVIGSYDPNDKRVLPPVLSPQEVQDGKRVEYTVRFQNTGSFPAERVLITDTLSSDLQRNTMLPVASSHANSWFIRNGVLHVLFENIDLPDSASDEVNSHGFFSFSMEPVSSLMLGESVGNVANIYFDFNTPVITNEAVFIVETSTGLNDGVADAINVFPTPATDQITIAGLWSGNKRLMIRDAMGRMVLERSTSDPFVALPIETLPLGGYTVQVLGEQRAVTKGFVKR